MNEYRLTWLLRQPTEKYEYMMSRGIIDVGASVEMVPGRPLVPNVPCIRVLSMVELNYEIECFDSASEAFDFITKMGLTPDTRCPYYRGLRCGFYWR